MRVRRMQWISAACGVLIASTLVAACGSSASGDASTGSGTGSAKSASGGAASSGAASDIQALFVPPASLPVTTPVGKPIPTGLTVVYLSSGVPQALTYLKGLRAAAAVLGWQVRGITYDQTNPATITSSIDSAIAQKPAAILLGALLPEQFAAEVPKARAAHVPLIPVVTTAKAEDGVYPVLRTDVESGYAAKILADAIVADASDSGKKAHVLQVTVPAFAAVLGFEDRGVKQELAAKCSSCTQSLININLPDVFNGKYVQQVVSYLQAHPDINYIVSDSGQLEDGLGAALAQAGLKSAKRYGFSPTNVQIQELKDGQPGVWAVQPYQVGGWQMADQTARVVTGGDTHLWDDEHLVYLVNAANSKGLDPADPEFPAGYQAQFKKLWNK